MLGGAGFLPSTVSLKVSRYLLKWRWGGGSRIHKPNSIQLSSVRSSIFRGASPKCFGEPTWMSRGWKWSDQWLGSMGKLFHLLVNGVFLGVKKNPVIYDLTIDPSDPNFLSPWDIHPVVWSPSPKTDGKTADRGNGLYGAPHRRWDPGRFRRRWTRLTQLGIYSPGRWTGWWKQKIHPIFEQENHHLNQPKHHDFRFDLFIFQGIKKEKTAAWITW